MARRFGVTCLYLLLSYKEAADLEINPEEADTLTPSGFPRGRWLCLEAAGIEAAARSFWRERSVTAVHWVERVLPHVPYRQWTLSFPHRIRWVLLKDVGGADPRAHAADGVGHHLINGVVEPFNLFCGSKWPDMPRRSTS